MVLHRDCACSLRLVYIIGGLGGRSRCVDLQEQ